MREGATNGLMGTRDALLAILELEQEPTMATQYYGFDRGEVIETTLPSTGTSSPGKHVEIAVNDAVGLTKSEVIKLVERLLKYIGEFDTNIKDA